MNDGFIANNIKAEKKIELVELLFLLNIWPISKILNIHAALVVEAFKPVTKVNAQRQNRVANILIMLPCLIKCKGLKSVFRISIIIPKCKPDMAKT